MGDSSIDAFKFIQDSFRSPVQKIPFSQSALFPTCRLLWTLPLRAELHCPHIKRVFSRLGGEGGTDQSVLLSPGIIYRSEIGSQN